MMTKADRKDRIDEYLSEQNALTNWLFFIIISSPFSLTGLLFAFVTGEGMARAEDNVLMYGGILLLFDILYIFIYSRKRMPSRKMLAIFGITNKCSDSVAENLAFDHEFHFQNDKKDSDLDPIDKKILISKAMNIIKKKFIIKLGILVIAISFLLFGLFTI